MTVPTRLLSGIEKLSIDDLMDLNKRVIRLIRAKRDVKSAGILATLRVGQKCQISLDHTWTIGKIVNIAIKKITVEVTDRNSHRKGHRYVLKPIPEVFRKTSRNTTQRSKTQHGASKKLSPQEKAWITRRHRQRGG